MSTAATVDNALYDHLAESWWDDRGVLNLLRTTVNPWRVPYFRRHIAALPLQRPAELLDIGCGGGLLAEEFARTGCRVTGIDPSRESLAAAREHARAGQLDIRYLEGFGNALPFPAASFDVVSCCDVLEHIENWDAVIGEIARVLRPGGLFLFDTINRTFLSWLVNIQLAQNFPPTRFLPRRLHVWRMFIRPAELLSSLHRHGLVAAAPLVGAKPRQSPAVALRAIRAFKRGTMTAEAVGAVAAMRPSRQLSTSYMGHALKPSTASAGIQSGETP